MTYGIDLTIPVMSITSEPSPEQILEAIKGIRLYGREDRGYPDRVGIKDIICYTNKQGQIVHTYPGGLDTDSEYAEELFEEHGILCRETTGRVYWLSTTKPNLSMCDASGFENGFQYRVFNNGFEDLGFDGFSYGNLFFDPNSKITKIDNPSLKKVVEAINPNSRLL